MGKNIVCIALFFREHDYRLTRGLQSRCNRLPDVCSVRFRFGKLCPAQADPWLDAVLCAQGYSQGIQPDGHDPRRAGLVPRETVWRTEFDSAVSAD